ncbi:MAG: DUF1080 domain-containing protein, partial [Planctomycetota bacterium]
IVRWAIASFCFTALLSFSSVVLAQSGGLEERDDAPGARGRRSNRPARAKFEELLENQNLDKFRGYSEQAIGDGWSISGKYLYFDGSGGGDIITRETYANFELQFEWKISEGGNSGVMYRVSLGDNAPYFSGPEYQVLDDKNHADGQSELTSAGALYGLYPAENKVTRSIKSFNKSKIIVEGNKIRHYLNNKKVLDVEIGSDDWNEKLAASKFKDWEKFAKNRSGHIAFQDHGDEVWYRNIRIKRLPDSEDTEGLADSGTLKDGPKTKSDRPARNPNPALSRFANKKKEMQSALQGAGGNKKKKDEKGDGDDDDDDKKKDDK